MKESKYFPDAFYRVTIRALIQEGDKFLLGHHKDGTWETFGGGLDFGEDIQKALQREVFEETGCKTTYISEQPILALPHIVHKRRDMDWFYNFPIYYDVKLDVSKFDFSRQYPEIGWFTLEGIQSLNIFEGEEGIKEGFRILTGWNK